MRHWRPRLLSVEVFLCAFLICLYTTPTLAEHVSVHGAGGTRPGSLTVQAAPVTGQEASTSSSASGDAADVPATAVADPTPVTSAVSAPGSATASETSPSIGAAIPSGSSEAANATPIDYSSLATIASSLKGTSTPTAAPHGDGAAAVSASQSSQSNAGLSTDAKVGIGIGVSLAFIFFLVALVVYKWRRRASPAGKPVHASINSSTDAVMLASEKELEVQQTQTQRGTDRTSHPAYASGGAHRLSDPSPLNNWSYTAREEGDEAPMYVGMPAHLSGDKRWSRPLSEEMK